METKQFKNSPESLVRVNQYLSKIKHPKTLKYVRGLSKNEKLFFCIIRERLTNNENNEIETGVKFSQKELKAFNIKTEKTHLYMTIDVNIFDNKLTYFAL